MCVRSFSLETVLLVLTSGELLRQILLEAHEQGMSNGEYAFLSIELIKSRATSDSSWYRAGDRKNKEAREMFESLLQISVRVPTSTQYANFVHDVVKRSRIESGASQSDVDVSSIQAARSNIISPSNPHMQVRCSPRDKRIPDVDPLKALSFPSAFLLLHQPDNEHHITFTDNHLSLLCLSTQSSSRI